MDSTVSTSVKTSITVNITKQTTETTTTSSASEIVSNSIDDKTDVEMEDLTADVEMIDAAPLKPDVSSEKVTEISPSQPTVTNSTTETVAITTPIENEKTQSTPKANGNGENGQAPLNTSTEQKIDDVEKNISNLFNGGESLKPKSTANEQVTPAIANTTQENGTSSTAVKKSDADKSIENTTISSVNDNNDLVSILTDDKPVSANESQKDTIVLENKVLTGVRDSVTSTPGTSGPVSNSTPIQKQFDIPSENVSTISVSGNDTEQGLGDKTTHLEIISSLSSTAKSPDVSTGKINYKDVIYKPTE